MKRPLKYLRDLLQFNSGNGGTVSRPLKAEWEVINTCNARCQTCKDWQSKPDSTILSHSESFEFVRQLAKAGLVNLTFTGGEPLLRKDLSEIVRFAKSQGLTTELVTNGLLINERRASKLIEAGLDRIFISLDAATPCLNDEIRGLKGYYELAVSAIDNLKAMRANSSPEIIIKTVVTHRNVKELIPLAELTIVKGIDGFCFNFAQTFEERNFGFNDSFKLDQSDYEQVELQIRKIMKNFKNVLVGQPSHYLSMLESFRNSDVTGKPSPKYEKHFVYIDSWGNIFASPAKKMKLGNIRKSTFDEMWFGQNANAIRNFPKSLSEQWQLADSMNGFKFNSSQIKKRSLFKMFKPVFNNAK